jgi:uncharacterized membrane protein
MVKEGAALWREAETAANGKDKGCFGLDLAKIPASIKRLMTEVAQIKGKGDKARAEVLLKNTMESRAKLLGHPVHQMLIVFPLGLLATAVIIDLVYFATDALIFAEVAYWLIVAGLIGGALAAPFGFIDWRAIPDNTRAKRIGAFHGMGNVVVLLLFLASALLRSNLPSEPAVLAYVCSFAGASVALVTAWLGGELVDRLGVGVSDGAHVDAPSSLRHRAT